MLIRYFLEENGFLSTDPCCIYLHDLQGLQASELTTLNQLYFKITLNDAVHKLNTAFLNGLLLFQDFEP